MDRRKKIIWILTGAAILVLAAAALLVWRHRGGGGEGTTIQSTKAHPLPKAVYYLQKDEEWAADPLGESRFTMGSSGCLVTCLATLFDLYGTGRLQRIRGRNLGKYLFRISGSHGNGL